MTLHLSRFAIVAIIALATASCGEDPVAPVEVMNHRFNLMEVEGARPPVDVETLSGDETCVNRILEGHIEFEENRYDLWLIQQRICPSGAFPSTERIMGSFVQDGGRITLDADGAPATSITSATLTGQLLRMTGTRASGAEFELEFNGNFGAVAEGDDDGGNGYGY